MNRRFALLMAAALGCQAHAQPFAHAYPSQFSDAEIGRAELRGRADIIKPFLRSPTAIAMAERVYDLPPRARRWAWALQTFDERTFALNDRNDAPKDVRNTLRFFSVSELVYYGGWTQDAPFPELRAYDIAVQGSRLAEPSEVAGSKILIVDPGLITHAWLLAGMGADVTIVSKSQRFAALYDGPSDRGTVRGVGGAPDGSVTIHNINWPADPDSRELVGTGYDMIFAINSLNNGRANTSAAFPRWTSYRGLPKDTGGTMDALATELHDTLAPGGRAVFYNWGNPPRAFAGSYTFEGDTRPAISPRHAETAGLSTFAVGSDASVFTRLVGFQDQTDEYRRQLDKDGLDAPRLSVIYAIYERPAAEN